MALAQNANVQAGGKTEKSNVFNIAEIKSLQTLSEIKNIQSLAQSNEDNLNHISEATTMLSNLCMDLSQRLEKEREKSAKLRRHIAKQSSQKFGAGIAEDSDKISELEALIKQQSELLEKLDQDGKKQQAEIDRLNLNNQQLFTANEKLRQRNIALRKEQKQSDQLLQASQLTQHVEEKNNTWLGKIVSTIKEDVESKRAHKIAEEGAKKRAESRKKQVAKKEEPKSTTKVNKMDAWLIKNAEQ